MDVDGGKYSQSLFCSLTCKNRHFRRPLCAVLFLQRPWSAFAKSVMPHWAACVLWWVQNRLFCFCFGQQVLLVHCHRPCVLPTSTVTSRNSYPRTHPSGMQLLLWNTRLGLMRSSTPNLTWRSDRSPFSLFGGCRCFRWRVEHHQPHGCLHRTLARP